jgi:hypothetical protein
LEPTIDSNDRKLRGHIVDSVRYKLRALEVRFRLPVLVQYSPQVERSLTLSIDELLSSSPLKARLPSIDTKLKTAISALSRLEIARLLLSEWDSFGPMAQYAGNLVSLLRCHAEEYGLYADLPEHVPRGERFTVYRGADLCEISDGLGFGVSWTLDQNVAFTFANENFYQADEPTVFRGRISRDAIFGMIFGRREREVILDPDYVREVKPSVHL